uniref:Uncharacterized protein n=1 Tax=Arundo donax TaxID=35708 RepID=A0A0A8Y910_ARUDO
MKVWKLSKAIYMCPIVQFTKVFSVTCKSVHLGLDFLSHQASRWFIKHLCVLMKCISLFSKCMILR